MKIFSMKDQPRVKVAIGFYPPPKGEGRGKGKRQRALLLEETTPEEVRSFILFCLQNAEALDEEYQKWLKENAAAVEDAEDAEDEE